MVLLQMQTSIWSYILMAVHSVWLNLVLTIMVIVFVIIMPCLDLKICRHLGINLQHRIGRNPKEDQWIQFRRVFLMIVFLIYICAYFYLVLFSRAEAPDHTMKFDCGFGVLFVNIVSGDFASAMAQINMIKTDDIAEALMNVMLYIPMGYLLPYVFKWFRRNKRRTILVCFLWSAATENLQLITRRGCYDFDDMIFNTLGGIIGLLLFLAFAYRLTHPAWKQDLRSYRKFKRKAAETALFKCSRQITCGRVSLLATSEETVYSFFVEKLGFRLKGQHVSPDSEESALVLKLGKLWIEFLCSDQAADLPQQTIVIAAERLGKLRKRLESKGISVSEYFPDSYNHHRSMYIMGPDNIKIVFSEF